ncbi:MAG TPA: bifunctional DNA-formamidopyrimidine glycosylase/DNA-(apurinic or apyrimidinic site) lyase, partial [Psychrobacter sp.]|nr:bifunctional DNA-formamidopyrimidine glycosylase/DNA-(apurinic or apyrimidinic site) lyase [Psychrobacter sp.]
TLDSVERRAKYLVLKFLPTVLNDNDAMVAPLKLLIHLGMSGSLQQHSYGTDKRKHDHLIVVFRDSENAKSQLHYYDPRRFGSVLWYEDYGSKLLDHLGPEPLSEDFTAEYLYNVIQRNNLSDKDHNNTGSNKKPSTKRTQSIARAIKSVIMEQKVVVGVGNIYATESLYLSGIHPATPANQLSLEQLIILVDNIKDILKKAIKLGGSTLRDFTVASGQTGYFQQTLNVYGRQGEHCLKCDTILENVKLNGRASVYCPNCQPLA